MRVESVGEEIDEDVDVHAGMVEVGVHKRQHSFWCWHII